MSLTNDQVNMLKIELYKYVDEGMTSATKMMKTNIDGLLETLVKHDSVRQREMELQFKNKICATILTGEEIRGEGGASLEVFLTDSCTGRIVDTGPEAWATVEILVLKGGQSDDACEGDNGWFHQSIVQADLPLLKGKVRLKLERGHGVIDGIKFRNHTVKMDIPPVFRLGARVADSFQGTQVKQATTQDFIVKDFRKKYNRKHDVPSLKDEVWRLKNIQKGGKIDERLRKVGIFNVDRFLTEHLKNPQKLERIVHLGPKKWEVTLNHARTCEIDHRSYCYINSKQNTGVVFDHLGNVLGLISKGCYASADALSIEDKAHSEELLSSARENWEKTQSFDSETELQKYLSMFTSAHPASSFQVEHITRPSETASKYGCVQLNSALPDSNHCSAERLRIDHVEIAHNHPTSSVDSQYSFQMTGEDLRSTQFNSSDEHQTQPSAEKVQTGDMDVEQGYPPEATSSVAPVDHPHPLQPKHNQNSSPSGVTDEFFYGGQHELLSSSFEPQHDRNSGPFGAIECFNGWEEILPDSFQPPQYNQNSGLSGMTDGCLYGGHEDLSPNSFQPPQLNQNSRPTSMTECVYGRKKILPDAFQPQQSQNSGSPGMTDGCSYRGHEKLLSNSFQPQNNQNSGPPGMIEFFYGQEDISPDCFQLQQNQYSGSSGVNDERFYGGLEELQGLP